MTWVLNMIWVIDAAMSVACLVVADAASHAPLRNVGLGFAGLLAASAVAIFLAADRLTP